MNIYTCYIALYIIVLSTKCSCLEMTSVAKDLGDAIRRSMELSGCSQSTYSITCGYYVAGCSQKLRTMVVITSLTLQEQIALAVACAISEVIPTATFKLHTENGEVVISITWTEESPLAQAQALWEQFQADEKLAQKLAREEKDAQMALELSAQLNGGTGARVHSGGRTGSRCDAVAHSGGHGDAVAHSGGRCGAVAHSGGHDGADGIQRSLSIAFALKDALRNQGISAKDHYVSNTGKTVYITVKTPKNPNMEPIIMAVTTVNPKAWVTCTRLDSKYTIMVSWPEPSLAEFF